MNQFEELKELNEKLEEYIKNNNISISEKEKNGILNIIKKHNPDNSEIKFIGQGGSSIVFATNDLVFKFGPDREIDYDENLDDKNSIQNILVDVYDKYEYVGKFGMKECLRVMEKLSTENILDKDLQYAYNIARENGYVWDDVKEDNLGRDKNGKLKILDDVNIMEKNNFLGGANKNVIEQTRFKKFEINYMIAYDPNFDIEKLGDYFRDYEYDEATGIRSQVDSLKDLYKEKVEEIEEFRKTRNFNETLNENQIFYVEIDDERYDALYDEYFDKYNEELKMGMYDMDDDYYDDRKTNNKDIFNNMNYIEEDMDFDDEDIIFLDDDNFEFETAEIFERVEENVRYSDLKSEVDDLYLFMLAEKNKEQQEIEDEKNKNYKNNENKENIDNEER